MRFSHGFVFQHLVDSDEGRTVSELAERMQMTAQGASKAVKELVALGYLAIEPGSDARVRMVRSSKRGHAVVADARKARQRLEAKLERKVGAAKLARVRDVLADTLEALGGFEAVKNRRISARVSVATVLRAHGLPALAFACRDGVV